MPKNANSICNRYIGLSEPEAIKQIKVDGYTYRVIGRDDNWYAITMDLSLNRINLVISGGKVITARFDTDI